MPPWAAPYLQWTAGGIEQQGGEREGLRVEGHEGGPGREEVGTHILSLAPLLLQGFLQVLHLGPQLQQLLLVQPAGVRGHSVPAPALCTRISRPLHAPARGGPPPPGGSSPQLRLQPVARAVGLLQVALQLLLPLPVGRLLLAQLLVLQLKPQERLPADRGREQGWRPVPLQACPGSGRETGRTGLQRDSAPGKGLAGPWSGLGVLGTQRRGTQNGRGLELG